MSNYQVIAVTAPGRFGLPSRRLLNAVGFLVSAVGLGFAWYAQFGLGLEPCPLCILQRLALLGVALLFLAAAVQNPHDWGARIYGMLVGLSVVFGAAIAARHVWLQHLPPEEVPRCGPGLGYMLQTFPLNEAIREVLTGSGECAKIDWTFLGLSIPAWALILFLALGVAGVLVNWRLRRGT